MTYNYKATTVEVEDLYVLERWRRVCLVGVRGQNHTIYLDGVVLHSWPWRREPCLLPDGALVIGQDQDLLMGGYTAGQSFRGSVTEMNIWRRALTSQHIQRFESCEADAGQEGDWVSWNQAPWRAMGRYYTTTTDPCQAATNSIIFFNIRSTYKKATKTLEILGLDPYLPRDQTDADQLQDKMLLYGENCLNDAMQGHSVWIRAYFNFTSKYWQDTKTGERLNFNLERRKRTYESLRGAVQVGNNLWITDDTENDNCFAGFLPKKTPIFYLRGIKVNRLPSKHSNAFILYQTMSKYLSFRGLQRLAIEYRSDQWVLSDEKTNTTLGVLVSEHLPVGRHLWYLYYDKRLGIKEENLTLSTCSPDHFTCDDGSCVKMSHRCDLASDCKDWSDERNCDIVLAPTGYLRSLPPSPSLIIDVDVFLDIIEVNLVGMTLVLDLSLELSWYDPHVTYRNLRPIHRTNIVSTKESECPLWQPSLSVAPTYSFAIQKSSVMVVRQADGVIKGDDTVFEGRENSLRKTVQLQPVVRCNFNLLLFPWDVQVCSFNIIVVNIHAQGMRFNRSSRAVYKDGLVLEEYLLNNMTLVPGEDGNTASITLVLERRYQKYLWDTFLPSASLLIIGYGTLFLPAESFSDRGTMSLTSLLVLVALYTDSLDTLPTIPYNTLMDIWYIFSIAFLGLIIATHLCTSKSPDNQFSIQYQKGNGKTRQAWSVPDTTQVHPTRAARVLRYARLYIIYGGGGGWSLLEVRHAFIPKWSVPDGHYGPDLETFSIQVFGVLLW
ncbi:Ligand-gated ion channel 50 [Portunus trituberculatus]|uniref:Ligand-gated ion channel 50 n=1 Tax=Portunus trituberculatus TaxID=210409 RepID=A0A5B7FGB6_PORTR|nr:Ligand-gated ion channel 50 [Portunus trituberculatus]